MDHILVWDILIWAIMMGKESHSCKVSHVLEIVCDIFGSHETLWSVKRAFKDGDLEV